MSIADVSSWLTFLVSKKMSCWQCCCSCLQHGGLEAKALVVWGLLHSLRLANCWVLNNFVNTIKPGGVWTKRRLHSSLSWYYPTTCSPSLEANLADCQVFGLAELSSTPSSSQLKIQSKSSTRWLFWFFCSREYHRDQYHWSAVIMRVSLLVIFALRSFACANIVAIDSIDRLQWSHEFPRLRSLRSFALANIIAIVCSRKHRYGQSNWPTLQLRELFACD